MCHHVISAENHGGISHVRGTTPHKWVAGECYVTVDRLTKTNHWSSLEVVLRLAGLHHRSTQVTVMEALGIRMRAGKIMHRQNVVHAKDQYMQCDLLCMQSNVTKI